jgi:hypothetical protein
MLSMNRAISVLRAVGAAVLFTASSCDSPLQWRTPDLSRSEAAAIISACPMFNQYARLLSVDSLNHAKGSMAFATFGTFTFAYLNSPADANPIHATAEFQYHDSKWHLDRFDYGCPKDCHSVDVHDGPQRKPL